MANPGPQNIVARRVVDDLIAFSGETLVPRYMSAKRREESKLLALTELIAEALEDIHTVELDLEILGGDGNGV
ncbi:hypothetical protein Tco_1234412 [Tanacetum coccineum]